MSFIIEKMLTYRRLTIVPGKLPCEHRILFCKDLLDHLFVGWPQENDNRIQLSKVKPLYFFRCDVQQAVFTLEKDEKK